MAIVLMRKRRWTCSILLVFADMQKWLCEWEGRSSCRKLGCRKVSYSNLSTDHSCLNILGIRDFVSQTHRRIVTPSSFFNRRSPRHGLRAEVDPPSRVSPVLPLLFIILVILSHAPPLLHLLNSKPPRPPNCRGENCARNARRG